MEIKGKVFIVTGGASGLGEGTARMLAAARRHGGDRRHAGKTGARPWHSDIGGAFVKLRCQQRSRRPGGGRQGRLDAASSWAWSNCAGIAPAEKPWARTARTAWPSSARPSPCNLIGSFNMIRLAADAMSKNEPEATGEQRRADLHRQRGSLRRANWPGGLFASRWWSA